MINVRLRERVCVCHKSGGVERERERERERAVKDVRKEEKGLRGSSLVQVFLTKEMGGFNDEKGGFWNKDELTQDKKGSI